MFGYFTYDVLVVGSGAAGLNAALQISRGGDKSVAIITEGMNMGTSRNTGSDKQTYYKLGLGGGAVDSTRLMAQDIFDCGAVDGDSALCEVAGSVRAFMRLCELGVGFPTNSYGEYVGYKTDHDPYARATSSGPLTSRLMTEALEAEVRSKKIPVFDNTYVIELLRDGERVIGLLGIDTKTGKLSAFRSGSVILATGGPAGIYADSVYPIGHSGSSGLALRADAVAQNLTEWQYGLASVLPRWNTSGSYMQALPRMFSLDDDGEHEFLLEYFDDEYDALSALFLKGYQWPFDAKKVCGGSSVIDLIVRRETVERRREVFLDFTRNPFGLEKIDISRLSPEASEYLINANVDGATPILRLVQLNRPAYELYLSKGVDLAIEPLKIALCAQHCNGGISVDCNWQTSVKGLFAVGECAGTHGVTRPGGSALNSGQVGSFRAAQFILASGQTPCDDSLFSSVAMDALAEHERFCAEAQGRDDNVERLTFSLGRRMSDCASAVRVPCEMDALYRELAATAVENEIGTGGREDKLWQVYRLRDSLLVAKTVLFAMLDFFAITHGSRGSAIYIERNLELSSCLDDDVQGFSLCDLTYMSRIQTVRLEDGTPTASWRDVRPIPLTDEAFEVVWAEYRKKRNI